MASDSNKAREASTSPSGELRDEVGDLKRAIREQLQNKGLAWAYV